MTLLATLVLGAPVLTVVSAGSTSDRPPDTSWPPALVYFAIFLLIAAAGAAYTIFRRARATTHRRR